MLESMIRNLEEKAGKSLPRWFKIAKAGKRAKNADFVEFLWTEYGKTHGYTNLIAQKTLQGDAEPAGDGDLVEAQYAGASAVTSHI